MMKDALKDLIFAVVFFVVIGLSLFAGWRLAEFILGPQPKCPNGTIKVESVCVLVVGSPK